MKIRMDICTKTCQQISLQTYTDSDYEQRHKTNFAKIWSSKTKEEETR